MTHSSVRWKQTRDSQLRRLVKTGLTNPQIAERMSIPLHIMRTRMKRLNLTRPRYKDAKHKNTTERDCLKCTEPFPSEGAGNRICDRCKAMVT